MAKLDFPDRDQSPWTNPDNGITYVWKGGPQGAWHIASAGDTDIFVAKAGDKMTGDLTLGPEGDTNITLNAADGSATFAEDVQVGGRPLFDPGVDVRNTGSIVVTSNFGGAALDFRRMGFSESQAAINTDGSATFKGQVSCESDSSIPLVASRTLVDSECFRIRKPDGNPGVVQMYNNGSATFSGNVTTPGVVFGTPSGNATSKTLDEYEEGTWTPTLNVPFSSSKYTGIANTISAKYTKIGNVVQVNIQLQTDGNPSDNLADGDALSVKGLPYAAVINQGPMAANGEKITDANANHFLYRNAYVVADTATFGSAYNVTGTTPVNQAIHFFTATYFTA